MRNYNAQLSQQAQQAQQAQQGKNPAMNAALQGNFISPEQLQNQLKQGLGQNINTITQLNVEQQKKANADIEAARLKLIQDNEKILLNQRDTRLQTEEKTRDTKLDSANQLFKANVTPTTTEKFNNTILNQNREYDKQIFQRQEELKKLDQQLQAGKKLLTNNLLTPEIRSETEKGLEALQRNKKETQNSLDTLQSAKAYSQSQQKLLFDRNEFLRQQTADLETRSQEISKLQNNIDSLKSIKALTPLDTRIDAIPRLEKELAIKQADLETTKAVSDIEQKMFNKELDTDKGTKQIANLNELNNLKKQNIELTYKQAEAEALTARNALDTQRKQIFNERLDTDAKNKIAALELIQRRNPTLNTTQNLELNRNLQLRDNQKNYEQVREQLRQNYVSGLVKPSEYTGLRLQDALNSNQSKNNINNTFSTNLDDQKIKDLQSANERKKTIESLSTSSQVDLLNARATEQGRRFDGNDFVAASYQRQAAQIQENIRYAQQLRDVQIQIEQAKFQGLDTTGLDNVANDLSTIHNLNLEGINIQFKDFATSVEQIGRESLKTLSQGLTDVILKGGSLNDVFDNIFNNILNFALNAAFNNIFSGLFGGGGGGGLLDGLLGIFGFADGGVIGSHIPNYALGGFTGSIKNAAILEKQQSGREPILVMAHKGELMIPADRAAELNNHGLTPNMLLGNYATGGVVAEQYKNKQYGENIVNDGSNKTLTIEYRSTEIAGTKYVSEEDFKRGMSMAAEEGGKRGAAIVTNKLQYSQSYRKNIGL